MESRKRKLPEWMTSPKKSEHEIERPESSGSEESSEENIEDEKPVVYIMSPSELEKIALGILSKKK